MSLFGINGTPRRQGQGASVPKFTLTSTASNSRANTAPSTPRQQLSGLPMSVQFDDLLRHYDHYNNYGCENEFLEFINSQDMCRKKWLQSEQEIVRLTTENQNARTELERNEKKMADFRRQFENKLEVVARLEAEKEQRKNRIISATVLIKGYLNDIRTGVETKDKVSNILALLEGVEYKRNPTAHSPGGALDTISEAETTDLSMTQSEDDLDFSVSRRTRNRNKNMKRTSTELQIQETTSRKKIRTSNSTKQTIEASGAADQVISQTIVSIPKSGGPVHAVSTLETIPSEGHSNSNAIHRVLHTLQPSAPPMTATSESESDPATWIVPPKYQTRSSISKLKATTDIEVPSSPNRFGRTLSTAGGTMKTHSFVTKTVIRPEFCGPCGKRIKFSKNALKCKDCRATCHPECSDKVPMPCVATSTPSNRGAHGQLGVIADYTPTTRPMVPALIQHCVNEIEIRGLEVVGLYRVPGSEKEVKELKERFLRGKGVPNLAKYDVHVICGCIKDFLRSLHEPLVGRWFWRDFAIATEISDPIKRQAEINRTLDELPPPNQDTLGFIIIHLQKIAEIHEIKMPIGNMAKVFGPTIIGYSGNDLSPATMLRETKKQQQILETLLYMSSEYWLRFMNRPQREQENKNNIYNTRARRASRGRFSSIGRTSTRRTLNIQPKTSTVAKKIYFQDTSPQGQEIQIPRPKKTYFE